MASKSVNKSKILMAALGKDGEFLGRRGRGGVLVFYERRKQETNKALLNEIILPKVDSELETLEERKSINWG